VQRESHWLPVQQFSTVGFQVLAVPDDQFSTFVLTLGIYTTGGMKMAIIRLKSVRGLKRHIFFPVATETAGSWSQQAIELVHHRGQQRNHLPVSETVRGSAEGKCSLILRHFPARLVRRCSHFYNF